jgi:hypothetical protein
MERILIILIILIILPISTYTGWYFGNITGYEKAKNQQDNSTNYNVKREVVPNQLDYKPRKRITPNRPSYKIPPSQSNYKRNQKTAQQSLNDMKRIVAKTKALNKKQVSHRSKNITEKSSKCRWTKGRIEKLTSIIKTGGKGNRSVFCSEYNKRVNELNIFECQTRISRSLC